MDLFDDIIRDVTIQVTNLQSRTRNNGGISIEGRRACIFFLVLFCHAISKCMNILCCLATMIQKILHMRLNRLSRQIAVFHYLKTTHTSVRLLSHTCIG